MVRLINQPNWRHYKQYIQTWLIPEKRFKELDKLSKENGYNDDLKGIYLREEIDRNKEHEWDQILDQIFD